MNITRFAFLILIITILISCNYNNQRQIKHVKQDSLELLFEKRLRSKHEIKHRDSFPSYMYADLKFPNLINIKAINTEQSQYLSSTISYYLFGFGEASLFENRSELPTYRLILLATFRHPQIIKLTKGDYTQFQYIMSDGICGYYVGNIHTKIEKRMDKSVWNYMDSLVSKLDIFNNTNIDMNAFGTDGTNLVLEYCDLSTYYNTFIRMPHPQGKDILNYLLNATKTDFDLDYVDE